MERQTEITLGGRPYSLLYSMSVLFDATERFEGVNALFDLLQQESRESAEAVFWLAWKMAEAGELARRYAGMDERPMPKAADFQMTLPPLEFAELKYAVTRAVELGYRRDVESNDEVDLGLLELDQKKTKAGA